MRHLQTFRTAIGATIVGLATAAFYGGGHGLLVVAMLIALETAISFDNAVVNAQVLRRLSPRWRRAFLTIGIVIAVFGMRVVFPIAVVSAATGNGFTTTVDQALHAPQVYAGHVERASAVIGAFGGMFLLMLSMTFFFEPTRERHWLGPIERALTRVGRVPHAATIVAMAALLIASCVVSSANLQDTLFAGMAGILTFLVVRGLRDLLGAPGESPDGHWRGAAGLGGFVYLETLDASFSLDGVLGAFAISSDIVLVALGLGVGAVYVRSATVALVRTNTMRRFPYLPHGAHWAVGALAIFLLVGIERRPPEWLTGCVGMAFIGASVLTAR
jgi:hypothetical protein